MAEYITCPNCGKEMTKVYYDSQHNLQCKKPQLSEVRKTVRYPNTRITPLTFDEKKFLAYIEFIRGWRGLLLEVHDDLIELKRTYAEAERLYWIIGHLLSELFDMKTGEIERAHTDEFLRIFPTVDSLTEMQNRYTTLGNENQRSLISFYKKYKRETKKIGLL